MWGKYWAGRYWAKRYWAGPHGGAATLPDIVIATTVPLVPTRTAQMLNLERTVEPLMPTRTVHKS
jgi:hypothetical protein